MTRSLTRALAGLALLALTATAAAHSFWPSLLRIEATAAGAAHVEWKIANTGSGVLPLSLRLPEDCQSRRMPVPTHYVPEPRYRLERYRVDCGQRLTGARFAVAGLADTGADVMVSLQRLDGRSQTRHLTAGQPGFVIAEPPDLASVLAEHFRLGAEHVLGGADHLLFVLALVLLLRARPGRLLLAVTVFTVAHALTLTLAVAGMLVVRPAPVEVLIALSIWLLAVELLRGDAARQAGSPFFLGVVFACGLLHGLGFASALMGIGVGEDQLAPALLAFNLGIEAGQIAFALAVYGLLAAGVRAGVPAPLRGGLTTAASYGLGTTAVYWTLSRLPGLVG